MVAQPGVINSIVQLQSLLMSLAQIFAEEFIAQAEKRAEHFG
ncbi:MAG: hypothetical protein AAGU75_23195 [Bacillota bacterium]